VTTFCWGGDVSSPSTNVSETSTVRDVLVRGATSVTGTSSSSLVNKNRQYKKQDRVKLFEYIKKGGEIKLTYELMRDSK
jgi:hypothetical protein